jgi:hypothetical protein
MLLRKSERTHRVNDLWATMRWRVLAREAAGAPRSSPTYC